MKFYQVLRYIVFTQGFLGTRADLLLDIMVTAIIVIAPLLWLSYRSARSQRYTRHRVIQITLSIVLIATVLLFEIDLRKYGNITTMTQSSRFAGTSLLAFVLGIHLFFAISTGIIWTTLLVFSLIQFKDLTQLSLTFSPSFRKTHRFWGRIAMIGMVFTGATALPLYILSFAL